MSSYNDQLRPLEIQFPEQPAPLNFAFRDRIDQRRLAWCRSPEEREVMFRDMKHRASHALAKYIAEHCKWFERPSFLGPEMELQIELTISDRGAYENLVPGARLAGKREGHTLAMKQCAESLPYGLADAAVDGY
jgi:hypothetical protein